MKHPDRQSDIKTPQEDGAGVPSPAQTSQQLTKVLFRQLMKTSLYVLAAAAIIVIASIAWFVSNTRVQSGTAPISADLKTIRLASTGTRRPAEENFLRTEDGTPLSAGTEYVYVHDGKTYHYTDSGEIALFLSDKGDIKVYPEASGSITFYIIPTQSGTTSVTLYLGLAGYVKPKNETIVHRVEDSTLDALLSGHILLFEQKDENGHYSKWLFRNNSPGVLNNSITVSLTDAQEGVPYPVTLYWLWPLRYENMWLDLYANDDPEYPDFLQFIDEQANMENMTRIPDKSYYYSHIFLTNETTLQENGNELADAASRSRAYNLADEYIGTNADYLYLTIRTDPTSL